MLLFLILSFLLLGNWILSDLLVFIPVRLVESLGSFVGFASVLVLLLFLGWCMGDG